MEGQLLQLSRLDPLQRWSLLGAGILLLIWLLMRIARKGRGQAKAPEAQTGKVQDQLQQLVVELEQLAGQITDQLDAKSARLEQLLRQADEKLASLRSAIAPRAQRLGPMESPAARQTPSPPAIGDAGHLHIYELADQGHSARQIAQQLQRPDGEIELILALREHAPPREELSLRQ